MDESEPSRGQRGITLGRAVRIKTLPGLIIAPFPERRIIHWLPHDGATSEAYSILVSSEVLLQTSHHVAQSLQRELGGFLLGNRYRCPNTGREYVIIDQYVAAEYTEGTAVSLTFTHEAWAHAEDKLTGKFYGKEMLGWYHSHPDMRVFLSDHDLIVHRERFPDPWTVALVLEPGKHLGGFFTWSDGKIDPNRYCDFYELLDDGRRESVMAWNNYEGVDPVAGGSPVIRTVNTASDEVINVEGRPVFPASLDHQSPSQEWLRGKAKWYGLGAIIFIVLLVLFWPRDRQSQPSGEQLAQVNPSASPGNGTGSAQASATQTLEVKLTDDARRIENRIQREEQERIERENRLKREAEEKRKQQAAEQLEKDKKRRAELESQQAELIIQMNDLAAAMTLLEPKSPEYKEKKTTFGSLRVRKIRTERDLRRVNRRIPKGQ